MPSDQIAVAGAQGLIFIAQHNELLEGGRDQVQSRQFVLASRGRLVGRAAAVTKVQEDVVLLQHRELAGPVHGADAVLLGETRGVRIGPDAAIEVLQLLFGRARILDGRLERQDRLLGTI